MLSIKNSMRLYIYIALILILIISFNTTGYSQIIRKEIFANRIEKAPQIDGKLNEDEWNNIKPATDFIQFEPINGAKSSLRSEVKFIYDDVALYVGAMYYDPNPDSIYTNLGERDNENINADVFAISIGTFDDGHNAFEFWVSASGVQIDKKISSDNGDINWNAVWESSVSICDSGWIAELKIPYSALRFPKVEKQKWAVIIWRSIKRYNELATWQILDKEVYGFMNQSGLLLGIENIAPPVRLSLMPYVSGYVNKYSLNDDVSFSYNGGIDLKYGINESFTLDMTLIPDFGQVESDDEVLNLSPFETKYDEKRSFFTEGTELFNKGGIFYSRRIGSRPVNYENIIESLTDNEEIIENPSETKMINATKISGRTNGGLGIGFFNAMTAESNSIIKDTLTNQSRETTTQPFTNYNILVLDKTLKNTSYVSIINSNVRRKEYTANVTATDFKILNKSKSIALFGTGTISNIKESDSDNIFGHQYNLKLAKVNGNFRGDLHQIVESDTYNPNDLGYLQSNNEFRNKLTLEYNLYKPVWKFTEWSNEIEITHLSLYAPRVYTEFEIEYSIYFKLRNNMSLRSHTSYKPLDSHDYFETRTLDQYLAKPPSFHVCAFFEPDRKNNFTIGTGGAFWISDYYNQETYYMQVTPTLRIGNNFELSYGLHNTIKKNDIGYIDDDDDNIYFGKRNMREFTQNLNIKYIFSEKSSISVRTRHYWSKAWYDNNYYELNDDGYLNPYDYDINQDINFNVFNIDMYYSYYFAPGSEISIAWKYAMTNVDETVIAKYNDNFRDLLNSPFSNNLSIRLLYYIDYNTVKNKVTK